jgi:hypothetical protein
MSDPAQQREQALAAITHHLTAGGDPEWTAPAILHELITLGWRPTCQPAAKETQR